MNTKKLKEALVELQQERDKLDGVISQLRSMIASAEPANGQGHLASSPSASKIRTSYIEEAVQILEQVGKPLHVKQITKRIAENRKTKVSRGSVESSIVRHISLGDRSQLARFAPSTYGLREWKPILAKNAAAPNFFTPDHDPVKQ